MKNIRKHPLFILLHLSIFLLLSGCGADSSVSEPPAASAEAPRREDTLLSLCQEIYEETAQNRASAIHETETLSVVQEITGKLGVRGITAIDGENQVDMTNPQQMHAFIDALDRKETADLSVAVVSAYDRFTEYDLHAEKGALSVVKTYYQYLEGAFENRFSVSFPADSWQYTDEGYFIFAGKSSSAQSLVLTMSDDAEFAAWRVDPLPAQYREWNRRYVLPVGYGQNNLFLVDWTENAYQDLDFYDLFDKFYPQVFKQAAPYTASKDAAVGAVYQIPEREFEQVLSLHLRMDAETLRAKTRYLEDAGAYVYRPRGFYEVEYPNLPYPEVVGGTENEDGTLTLLVNAVYPARETSRAFSHELVVRPDAHGFQYVSNRALPGGQDCDMGWHTDRLTEDAWEEVYGQACLLTEAQQTQLEEDVLTAAGQVSAVFQADVSEGEPTPSRLTREQCEEAVSLLGNSGFVSTAKDVPMKNPEQIEVFYADYREQRSSQATVFQVNADRTLDALTFLHEDGKLQAYYIGVSFRADGTPKTKEARFRTLASVDLTPKGYFIYAYKETPQYAAFCQYWRIRPLSDACRELTEKYIRGLSYVNYNMLVTDWDSGHAETILTPSMYEDLCRIHTGQAPEPQNGQIPADQYEQIMMLYLPVNREQIRAVCGYDEKTHSYPYEVVMHRQYPPFGEVTDYMENPDGTITLTVDGVWVEKGTDCAFTNTIVVQPFEDGAFRYLSNSIEPKDTAIPYSDARPAAQ